MNGYFKDQFREQIGSFQELTHISLELTKRHLKIKRRKLNKIEIFILDIFI